MSVLRIFYIMFYLFFSVICSRCSILVLHNDVWCGVVWCGLLLADCQLAISVHCIRIRIND